MIARAAKGCSTKALIEHPNAGKQPMRATEVLKQYADGRRDFSGENLTGQSFKGKDLSEANFSEADIRGANFTNATPTGTHFSSTQAGLQSCGSIFLVVASFLTATLSALTSVNAAGILRVSIGNEVFEKKALIFGIAALTMNSWLRMQSRQ
jgi:hypothetical protein